jgi:tRNA1(Val) A37 N6-methylase TrmN6
MRRINVFDWDDERKGFGGIMKKGGFDCVIGNPPYVRQELLKEQKEYFKAHYRVYQGTADLYAYFIEKGVSLLSSEGLFSIIVANKWLRANYGKALRQWLKRGDCRFWRSFGVPERHNLPLHYADFQRGTPFNI